MSCQNLNVPLRVVTVLWGIALVVAIVISVQEERTQEAPPPQPEVTAPVAVYESPAPSAMHYNVLDVEVMAKILYREARGISSKTEQACVGWVICNRVDAGYASTPTEVMTAPNQFAYIENTPIVPELYALAGDVLDRWSREKNGETDVGRVLPKEYLWFSGDGQKNHFRNQYSGGTRWDYSLLSPYES